jgi:hypothetical protein
LANSSGVQGGFAPLDSGTKIPIQYMPDGVITNTFEVFTEAAMLALTAQRGDFAIRYDTLETYILQGDNPALLSDWQVLVSPNVANANLQFNDNRSHNQSNKTVQFNDAAYWRWVTTLAEITELNPNTKTLSFTAGANSVSRTLSTSITTPWETWARSGSRVLGWYNGAAEPEAVVSAEPSSIYIQDDTTSVPSVWIKRSGTGNTGWAQLNAPNERLVTATGSEVAGDNVLYVDASGGAITLSLLTPSVRPRILTIKKIDTTSNPVTIDAGSSSVDGFTTRTLTIHGSTLVIATTGSVWRSVGNSVNEAGQIKANYAAAALRLVNFTAGVAKTFDLNAATATLSTSPTTTFPYSSPTRTYADMFDSTRGTTPTGRLVENPIGGQVHTWRVQGTYANKAAGNSVAVDITLRNPVSGFSYTGNFTAPIGTTSGAFNVLLVSIADSASIPAPNGYVLDCVTYTSDADLTVDVLSITRISNAVE